MPRVALLSMDVEDWYHLEYLTRPASPSWSVLDGIDRFADCLAAHEVPATFFCVGEILPGIRDQLIQLQAAGHEIASHGPDHGLPYRLSTSTFVRQLEADKARMEDQLGQPVFGYRAPCLALDRPKLESLAELGFLYDSSFIDFPEHPLYGQMRLDDWEVVRSGVLRRPKSNFLEFSLPQTRVGPLNLPVGGGGYFRLFPWSLTRLLLERWKRSADVFAFYIHPFECSARPLGPLPQDTSVAARFRFKVGRGRVIDRLNDMLCHLKREGFTFTTFSSLREELCPGR